MLPSHFRVLQPAAVEHGDNWDGNNSQKVKLKQASGLLAIKADGMRRVDKCMHM